MLKALFSGGGDRRPEESGNEGQQAGGEKLGREMQGKSRTPQPRPPQLARPDLAPFARPERLDERRVDQMGSKTRLVDQLGRRGVFGDLGAQGFDAAARL